ncbi:DUF6786 family protein [Seonamhaeicola marinus]|uniref:DUF4380 domain-containing protein n=1 Tax=Seonamhaeicola marinus TaxID=1912246 RepID=A0A5D0IM13_9FLAO|nr:DUF6786 family protein [Seonamhaeicola marinus]TYA84059.1 hypothetical protein FUA24_05245 [Seonamhaeicola marinus]
MKHLISISLLCFLCLGCSNSSKKNYNYYLNLVENQHEVIELVSNEGNSRILVSPYHQGRILTSTYNNLNGMSNGWINEIALKDSTKSIGGEERLWIGPLGSQFSFYFQQLAPIHDDNWKVPATMEAEPYQVVQTTPNYVKLSKKMHLTNFIGTTFNLEVNRKISNLSKETIQNNLNINVSSATKFVAFETEHQLKNLDTIAWTKDKGLAGLWSAGMYPGDDSVIIIPLKNNGRKQDVLTYLAALDSTRFVVKNNAVLFKGDGQYRSKIGVPPQYAPSIYGCYSKTNHRLTIIQYKKEQDTLYSNSYVSIQDKPYKGEAIPIYNNGSDFYELESNAPLKELRPNATTSHWHRVYHFSSTPSELNAISTKLLGLSLNDTNL